jgi:ankyrin repeat protein
LSKGAPIDVLDANNQNCLDIAISRGNREVVKVLLNDKNWHKLINSRSLDRISHKVNLMNVAFKKQINRFTYQQRRENPQLVAMFENKMWDSIGLILDKCKNGLDYDFTKLDPPCKNIQRHPLMLMARSGQETLLKHNTVIIL